MVELEIDGKKVEVANGSMVMHAAQKLDIYVPHFCYHKKLSIAANCRMCLVDVEKAPKPVPACATPVTPGMKVWTASERAVKAQKGVMEFLLINHPLDCPICDQGGECQLQDLAVGYGGSTSRYDEVKRVVFHKPLGPLVSAEEMSRCIHCTRCVRFGQEIAGQMELGMAGRGEHSEIMSFVGRTVESELSGNMIDVCPVGALTSKPFRYSARTWELARRRSVAPHDSLGSNVVVQSKSGRVLRVVPLENDAVNECWLSDRDRFSYEGLNSSERLTTPMIRQDGKWIETDWNTALTYAANALTGVRDERGAAAIGALGSPQSTLEELFLLGRTVRGLGSENIDFRGRQRDFGLDASLGGGAPWLGMPVAEVGTLDRLLLVGSFLRKEQPLLASRIRQAAKAGAQVSVLHATDDDLLMPVAARSILAPSLWLNELAGILVACLQARGLAIPADLSEIQPSSAAQCIGASLASGAKPGILLGNAVLHGDRYTPLAQLAQRLADVCGGRVLIPGEGANAVGGVLAGAVPRNGGLDARRMVTEPLSAYVLLNHEPDLDHGMPAVAMAALRSAQTVIALTPFTSSALLEVADCLLPVSPFTETSGTFVSAEGRVQSFNGVVPPLGQTRPAWKVLRVLANVIGIPGMAYDSSEAVRDEALAAGVESRLAARLADPDQWVVRRLPEALPAGQLERVADVPLYFTDGLVRRAASLQQTRESQAPRALARAATIAALGLEPGAQIRVTQGQGDALVELQSDERVAAGCLRLSAAHRSTSGLASMFGAVTVTRA